MATLALQSPKSEQVPFPVHDRVPAYGMQLACGPTATLLAAMLAIALAVAMAYPLVKSTVIKWHSDSEPSIFLRPDWLDLA